MTVGEGRARIETLVGPTGRRRAPAAPEGLEGATGPLSVVASGPLERLERVLARVDGQRGCVVELRATVPDALRMVRTRRTAVLVVDEPALASAAAGELERPRGAVRPIPVLVPSSEGLDAFEREADHGLLVIEDFEPDDDGASLRRSARAALARAELVHRIELERERQQRQRIAALNMLQDADESLRRAESAEAALKRAVDELEVRNRELEAFTSTASHDLKSPLVTVEGYAKLVAKDLARGAHDRLPEFASRIEAGCARMRRSIDDLLDLCILGRDVGPFTRVPAGAIVGEILEDLRGEIADRGATVHVEPLPDVVLDRPRLRRVLLNLVANAIRHGGTDEASPTVRVSGEADAAGVELRVQDDGRGVPPEDRERIFELFQRSRGAARTGTGLGLAIVARALEVVQGRCHVEDAPGGGARFVVRLPHHRATVATAPGRDDA